MPSLHQRSFSVNGVIKPALLLIQWKRERERERERERICSEGMELWNGQGGPANTSQGGFEMKRTSRQLCNVSRRREADRQRYIEGGGGGKWERREATLVHFNGIYIKAWQISSWVLDVRGSKKPFRHTACFLIVKIDGAVYSFSCVCVCARAHACECVCACREEMIKTCRHCSGF